MRPTAEGMWEVMEDVGRPHHKTSKAAMMCKQKCPPGFQNTLNCDKKRPATYCPNQCNRRGTCHAGFCACSEGWWGIDCSLRVPAPATAEVADAAGGDPRETRPLEYSSEQKAPMEMEMFPRLRARPLIYVYETPSDFNSGQHQRRFKEEDCVPRTYEREDGGEVRQEPTRWYYSLEASFHEYLLQSPHRTTDPAEADFFFAPVYSTCFHLRYNKPTARHWAWNLPPPSTRPHGTWKFWTTVEAHLRDRVRDPVVAEARRAKLGDGQKDPLLSGDMSDHIFVTPYDEGACYLPKELGSAVFITHWGNTGTKHDHSTTGFGNDNWDALRNPKGPVGDVLGGWRCYDPAKDIVVPPWNVMRPKEKHANPAKWARGRRPILFFFAGDLGTAEGIPDSGPHKNPKYSMGIRQRVTKLLRDRRGEGFYISGNIGDYEDRVKESTFCGVFPGDGWSGGLLTYVRHGCIPLIIQDGVDMPFGRVGGGEIWGTITRSRCWIIRGSR